MTITLGFWSVSVLVTLVMMAFSLYLTRERGGYVWSNGEFIGCILFFSIPVLWVGLLIGRLLS